MQDTVSKAAAEDAARAHWRGVMRSTAAIDRTKAKSAVNALYAAATGQPPAHILFFDSPRQAEIAGTFLAFDHHRQSLTRGPQRPILWDVVVQELGVMARGGFVWGIADVYRSQLERPLAAALAATRLAGADREAFDKAYDTLLKQIPAGKRAALIVARPAYERWLRMGRTSDDARQGGFRQWLAWAAYHHRRRATGEHLSPEGERLASAVMGVCTRCGSGWFYPDIAVITDRPTTMQVDDANRLHADDGPALLYRDGFGIYAQHGVRVARWVIEHSAITVADVESEFNAEVRRVLIEKMGAETYLSASGARLISRDETGALWRRDLPGNFKGEARAWYFVEVVNGTAEKDGTHKRYLLRVPHDVRTAREAVAWTYGLTAEAYVPHIRT